MDQYPPPPVYASAPAPPTPGNGNLETGHVAVYPPPPPPALARGLPVSHGQLGGGAPGRDSCEGHDPSALLVGATLITMLAFLLDTFIPADAWRPVEASL
ncbi:uncharacterized protein C2845_PM02G31310 [Panicum miliaceum]|uniref:Uncharacterized protein n=1 Tax=Panicum miliaceum TaxID=4540 RepID=A0A3L6SDP3_PANMI|nr:uncharacterized protein C2845_PM02G31310 [Panicum miliaceum]